MLIRWPFLAVVGLATLAPAAADAQTRTRRAAPAQRSIPPQTHATFERGLLSSNGGPLYLSIRRNFPTEYRAMIDRYVSIAMANRMNPDRALQLILADMLAFQRSILPLVATAPTADIMRVIQARITLLAAAQRVDPVLCGRLAMRGNPGGGGNLPGGLSPLMMATTVAMIDAAGAGRRTPVAARTNLTSEENETVRTAFTLFDPNGDLLPLLGGEEATMNGAAPELQCRYGLALYRTVVQLPQELAARTAMLVITGG